MTVIVTLGNKTEFSITNEDRMVMTQYADNKDTVAIDMGPATNRCLTSIIQCMEMLRIHCVDN